MSDNETTYITLRPSLLRRIIGERTVRRWTDVRLRRTNKPLSTAALAYIEGIVTSWAHGTGTVDRVVISQDLVSTAQCEVTFTDAETLRVGFSFSDILDSHPPSSMTVAAQRRLDEMIREALDEARGEGAEADFEDSMSAFYEEIAMEGLDE